MLMKISRCKRDVIAYQKCLDAVVKDIGATEGARTCLYFSGG